MESFREVGVNVLTKTSLERMTRGFVIFGTKESRGGADVVIEADLVLHAAGRVPDLDPLDLDAGGVGTSGVAYSSTRS
jgi:glutathione reductase (NADPH)